MKRFLFFSPIAILALAGCGAPSTQTPAAQVRGLAASFAAGRAFDRASAALKSSDNAALQNASRQYARASAQIDDKSISLNNVATALKAATAESLSLAAMQLELEAKSAPLAQRDAILARALGKYRAASDFLPANPKLGEIGADTLNTIGYPLADRGTTRADWQRAAQLTRLSLREWDKLIQATPPDSARRLNLQVARTFLSLDSYAWALFRLGRVEEAVTQQEKVIAFARQHPEIISGGGYNAEIPYHMAEIYRAAGRESEARQQYQIALDLRPDPELLQRINVALNAARV